MGEGQFAVVNTTYNICITLWSTMLFKQRDDNFTCVYCHCLCYLDCLLEIAFIVTWALSLWHLAPIGYPPLVNSAY